MEDVIIGFQDETRIGQQGSRVRFWSKKGERTRVVKQGQFISAYIVGTVIPSSGQTFAIVVPDCNTYAMNHLLSYVAKEIPEGKHLLMVTDCASWHKSKDLIVPTNITLMLLPPYSPELNPIEQVWQFIKRRFVANRVFKDYKAILDASVDALEWIQSAPNKIKSLTTRKWATLCTTSF